MKAEVAVERQQFERSGRSRVRTLYEGAIGTFFFSCAFLSVIVTVGIILVLTTESAHFFKYVTLSQFFLDTEWTPLFSEKHFGIWPLVCGTVLTSAIAISVALPAGLTIAIYLSEFADGR